MTIVTPVITDELLPLPVSPEWIEERKASVGCDFADLPVEGAR